MIRAWILFRRAMPDVHFSVWPVVSGNRNDLLFWRTLLIEYSKTILTWIS
jgi:uncharacterized SAM-binding protein YcdF (DUF218 family)